MKGNMAIESRWGMSLIESGEVVHGADSIFNSSK